MLKNLKKVAAIVLSFAMAVQFGLADSYYVNAVEEPVEPQQQEETTTTTPQEQEQVPTTEEETPQQQEEGQQQPAVEEEQPAAEEAQQPAVEEEQPATEEAQPQPQPVKQAKVNVSYVKEDDTDLMESVTATYDVGYRLDQDTNVFKEAHEAFEFEYAFVNGNKENKITKDQVKASGLTVTSDMTSLTLVYKSTATQKDSKDKKVKKANLSGKKEDDSDSDSEEKNISVASDTAKTRTIKVGETVRLTSKDVDKHEFYNHNWTVEDGSKVKLNKTSGVSITVTGLKEGTTTVTDTYLYKRTKKYTITVNAAVTPTGISISGADKVTQFQTTQLTANLTPADANGKVTWTSSNEQILSVDENGKVTGNRQGSATITASVQGADNKTLSATKTIEVVKNESPSGNNKQEALVYYLIDPTKDANSNDKGNFGSQYGIANVNVEGATWRDNKNCFDNVDQRVVSWPNNTNVISRSSEHWNIIFDNYKTNIQSQLGVEITADDVEEITLVPAKISKNNWTNPDKHLDCNVNIKCKSVALVKYYLFDANGTNWEMLGSKNYLVNAESTTQPSDVTSMEFPPTKTVNGVTYTFSGWYTDQSLTTSAPSFPAKVTGSVTYYAKYVAGYQVTYNLAGGQFSDGSISATEKHNVDTDVVVKEAPTRKGYKFTGWTVEGLDDTTTINSGNSFTMPNGNVTLTAQWTKDDSQTKELTYTVNHVIGTTVKDTKTYREKVWVNDPDTIKIVKGSLDQKTYTGYKFDSMDPAKVGTTIASGSTITLTYVKDDSQTKELTYTVNHVIGTTVKDTKTYREKVWVNDPDTIKIVKGSLDQKTYTGYKFDSMDPAKVGTTIASGSTITLTYVKDDSQTKELTYTVNHVIGTTVKDTKTYREKVWVNDPDTIKIVKGSLDQKTYTGYKFDSMDPAKVGTTIASGSTITLTYVKDDSQTKELTYTVNHVIGTTVKDTKTYREKVWVNDPDTIKIVKGSLDQKTYTGYKFDSMDPAKVGTTIASGSTITLTYVKDDSQTKELTYTVNHVIGTTVKDTKTYREKVWVNDPDTIKIVKGSLDQKTYTGYKFDSMDPAKVGTTIASGSTITLTYVKDDSQTKELTYTVNHVIGTTVKDTKTYREKVWVNDPDTIKIVKGSLDQKTYTGYKFDSMDPAKVGTTIASGSTITLTYVKDDSQTKELTYTVNHVIGTTVKDTKTYREKVWVNDPDTIKIVKGSLDQKTYTGYKFDSMDPAKVGTTIASGSTITLTYVKDDSQTKELTYTVNHVIGTTVKDTKTYREKVWVNDPDTIKIVKGSLDQKTYTGYKFDSMDPAKVGTTIASGSTITLTYVKDDSQTKELTYTVNHVIGTTVKDTKTYREKVWVNDPDTIKIVKGSLDQKTYTGYKFDSMDPAKVGTTIASGSTITLTYVKDDSQTKELTYTVNHVIGTTVKDTKTYREKVWVNDPDTIKIVKGSLDQKTYTGYKFDSMDPAKVGTTIASGSTITLTYVKDDSQTKELTYTVNHVIGTTVKDTKTYREKVWVNDPDTIKIVKGSLDQKTYTGYKFDSMDPAKVGTTIASGSTITLTYVKDDSQTKELTYTVNHVIGTTVKDTKTYREKVWVNDPDTIKIVKGSLDQKTYTGYKFDSMDPAKVGTTIASGSTITLTYVKDDSQTKELTYTVNHVIGTTVKDTKTYREKVWVNDPDTIKIVKGSLDQKTYTGYKFDSMDPAKVGTTIASGSTITLTYTIESYDLIINYVYEGGAIAAEPHTETLDYNTAYSVTSPVIPGYTASSLTVEGNMPTEDKTITVVYSANTNTAYTVRHLFQNTTQDGYDLNVEMTQTLAGTTGFATAAKAEIVAGFTAKAFGQRPIAGDGSTVIDIYYDRNTVTLTYAITGDYFTDEEFATVSGVYGTTVTPSVVPSQTGYTFSGWTNEPSTFPATSMTVTGEYTIRTDLHYEIHYFYDGVENEEEMIVNDNATFNSPITISAPATKDVNGVNYMLESVVGLDKLVSVNADENIINVYYTKDSNGGETDPNDPTNPNKPDDIPDKYQVKISYKAVNGTLNFTETYVTLYDEEGNYSETGKGILDAKQIPYASPNNGYNNGKWDVEPTVGMEITKDAEFTITFSAIPPVVPAVTPATPSTPSTTPRTPSTPSTTPRTLSAPQVTTPVETVEKETTPKAEPKKEEKVEEEYTPKASPQYYWALINLICAILTVLFGLLLLISKRHKDEDDDEEDDETQQQTTNDDEEKEQEKKRGLFTRVLAVLIAIVSVVFFLVTEDLSLPWTWTDQWTIWMVVIGLVQIVVFFVGRKWKNVDNDDEDEEAQQA